MFDKVEELRGRIQELGKRFVVAGPQPEAAVIAAEELVGTSFPPSYRTFLLTYGAGFGITGIWKGDASAGNPGTLWGDTQRLRKLHNLPGAYIPIYFIPLGGVCCLDSNRRDEKGECPVVQLVVPKGSEALEVLPHSTSFLDFLIWHLEQTLKALEEVAG